MQPAAFKRGREFEARVKKGWESAEGDKVYEKTIPLLPPKGRVKRVPKGRMDIFIDEAAAYVAIVEIKATNWDRIKPKNVVKNLGAQRRQVWKYIEKYLDGDKRQVCPGIIYPAAPKTPGLKDRIESYLNDYGLQVVWYDD